MEKRILVLGVSRGGTTLVAAALGAHPQVAMLDEDLFGAMNKVTGGKIGGVKLCVPNHIEWERRWHWIYTPGIKSGFLRKSKFMNKIPKSVFSVRDYLDQGPVIPVCVLRDASTVVDSIMRRENKSKSVATYRWKRCMSVFNQLRIVDHKNLIEPVYIRFDNLLLNPETSLKKLCLHLDLDYSENMLEAPARNSRYRSKGFDKSKAGKNIKALTLPNLSKDDYRLYDELCSIAI